MSAQKTITLGTPVTKGPLSLPATTTANLFTVSGPVLITGLWESSRLLFRTRPAPSRLGSPVATQQSLPRSLSRTVRLQHNISARQ